MKKITICVGSKESFVQSLLNRKDLSAYDKAQNLYEAGVNAVGYDEEYDYFVKAYNEYIKQLSMLEVLESASDILGDRVGYAPVRKWFLKNLKKLVDHENKVYEL